MKKLGLLLAVAVFGVTFAACSQTEEAADKMMEDSSTVIEETMPAGEAMEDVDGMVGGDAMVEEGDAMMDDEDKMMKDDAMEKDGDYMEK